MYDITARDTFESLGSWINELDTFAGTGPASREVVRMIVGNKVDKVSAREPFGGCQLCAPLRTAQLIFLENSSPAH